MRVLFILLAILAAVFGLAPATARADEVAPELERADLRVRAQAELSKLVATLPEKDKKRLTGVYAAFDPSVADPIAQVACDDDGDPVVVLSDAMLELLAHLSRAAASDEGNDSRNVEEYARFLARSQTPGRRLMPPPPGFYAGARAGATHDPRLRELLAFVIACELTRLRAGDLVCPRPTSTKESGDDVWTDAEQRKAVETASTVYPGHMMERDEEALVLLLDDGNSDKGATALLRFFTQFEVERRVALGRFTPSYLTLHPSASMRLANLKRIATEQTSK
ncbi:MAG TPA: hypothetical protein VM580_00725 [Labilithrix sp.]|jgi:hypothetical protein|nr:hypothetical protein [Labilithrix sp.]